MSSDNIRVNAVDTAMISVGTKSMGGGTVTTIIGYMSSSGFAVLIGVLVTILGFAFSVYFQRRQHCRNREKWELERQQLLAEETRKQELHYLKMRQLRESLEDKNETQGC